MRQFRGVVRGVDGFTRNREGNLAVLFGAAASVLALGVGFAVNISQLYDARSSLQGVVDAAVTSTAHDLTLGVITETDANKTVQAFLDANSTAGTLQANQVVLDKLTVNRTANTVRADAHVDVGLFFPLFSTSNMRRVTASTTALYSDKTIEVAMMLDVTGSMAGQKIKDLRTAAGNAVNSFLTGQNAANPRVRVAIVPYANSVNVGSLAASTVFVETKASERKQAPGDDDPKYVSASTRPELRNRAQGRLSIFGCWSRREHGQPRSLFVRLCQADTHASLPRRDNTAADHGCVGSEQRYQGPRCLRRHRRSYRRAMGLVHAFGELGQRDEGLATASQDGSEEGGEIRDPDDRRRIQPVLFRRQQPRSGL
ncbi:TadE/TadG family type IV pilus assembly protein [Mesorhizobium sp. CA8]|uniref:TadE/TadG family type IV pilus assembly protein n=1 Tax=Mesorhizobium sp. CA8 TaxID=2876637 RepID=UPI00296220F8|nr:TadE/TadG family type IV pilus assembly protein [Mesorhizobium sp. CA8]